MAIIGQVIQIRAAGKRTAVHTVCSVQIILSLGRNKGTDGTIQICCGRPFGDDKDVVLLAIGGNGIITGPDVKIVAVQTERTVLAVVSQGIIKGLGQGGPGCGLDIVDSIHQICGVGTRLVDIRDDLAPVPVRRVRTVIENKRIGLTALAVGAFEVKRHGPHPDVVGKLLDEAAGCGRFRNIPLEHPKGLTDLGNDARIDEDRRKIPELTGFAGLITGIHHFGNFHNPTIFLHGRFDTGVHIRISGSIPAG